LRNGLGCPILNGRRDSSSASSLPRSSRASDPTGETTVTSEIE
jgi:hypothetical protein